MIPSFRIALLTRRAGWPDLVAAARILRQTRPEIGEVEALTGARLEIEGAVFAVRLWKRRMADEALYPPLAIGRRWDPTDAVERHRAAIEVRCETVLPGREGALAGAVAIHLVADAIARQTVPLAVLALPGRVLSEPQRFSEAADALVAGRLAVQNWIGFAPVKPAPDGPVGMASYGLSPFLGRELELVPRPGDADAAYRLVNRVARDALAGRIDLSAEQRIEVEGLRLRVRRRSEWLRPDQPVFLLVADDAIEI